MIPLDHLRANLELSTMKKSHIWLTCSGVVLTSLFSLHLLTYWCMQSDYRILSFLASDPTLEAIEQRLGRPDETILANQELEEKGWPLPKADREMEIWIYSSRTGRNFYVHVNRPMRRIEYVFSSSS
jgi:hypothetical protein